MAYEDLATSCPNCVQVMYTFEQQNPPHPHHVARNCHGGKPPSPKLWGIARTQRRKGSMNTILTPQWNGGCFAKDIEMLTTCKNARGPGYFPGWPQLN